VLVACPRELWRFSPEPRRARAEGRKATPAKARELRNGKLLAKNEVWKTENFSLKTNFGSAR